MRIQGRSEEVKGMGLLLTGLVAMDDKTRRARSVLYHHETSAETKFPGQKPERVARNRGWTGRRISLRKRELRKADLPQGVAARRQVFRERSVDTATEGASKTSLGTWRPLYNGRYGRRLMPNWQGDGIRHNKSRFRQRIGVVWL